ncbi:MAG TPA: ribonuclease HII [Euzebyales bacterium]|nr:ribonuclease HII [Euzebyales bacterium]
MGLPAAHRRNVVTTAKGRRIRLPDVPGVTYERPWWDEDGLVAGVDEVGRGAWAGPVTFAAVVLPSDRRMYKLRDSKMLDAPRREELAARLRSFALGIGLGHATNGEIDAMGMSDAMRLAASRAVAALSLRPDAFLVDGNWNMLPRVEQPVTTVVHGDATSASIAAASIVAKVTRDALMRSVCPTYPRYVFSSNKGYPSPPHVAALDRYGPCVLHRHSWAPIRARTTPSLDLQLDPP